MKTMKTTINNRENSTFEFVKRFIYSFQMLMVGIAIPVLFIIGISNGNQKKSKEPVVNEVTNTTQLSPRQVAPLMPRI